MHDEWDDSRPDDEQECDLVLSVFDAIDDEGDALNECDYIDMLNDDSDTTDYEFRGI